MLSTRESKLLRVFFWILILCAFTLFLVSRAERIKQASGTVRKYSESVARLANTDQSIPMLESRLANLKARYAYLLEKAASGRDPAATAADIKKTLRNQGIIPRTYKIGQTKPDEYVEFAFKASSGPFFSFLKEISASKSRHNIVLLNVKANARLRELEITMRVRP